MSKKKTKKKQTKHTPASRAKAVSNLQAPLSLVEAPELTPMQEAKGILEHALLSSIGLYKYSELIPNMENGAKIANIVIAIQGFSNGQK